MSEIIAVRYNIKGKKLRENSQNYQIFEKIGP